MGSSSHHLDSALTDLHNQLREERWRFGDANKGVGGLRGILEPNSRRIGDDSLYRTLELHVESLEDEWRFFRTFLDYVRRWTNADEVVNNLGSLVMKIEAAAGDIATDIGIAYQKKYVSRKPSQLIDLLGSLKSKIRFLASEPEFGEALDSVSGCSLQLHSPLQDCALWIKSIEFIEKNMKFMVFFQHTGDDVQKRCDALKDKLKLFVSFLRTVQRGFRYGFPSDHIIEDFFNHAASVVIRTASLCFFHWFKERHQGTSPSSSRFCRASDPDREKSLTAKVLDLLHEIDPANPEFLELNLKFLKGLNKAIPGWGIELKDLADIFLKYSIGEKSGYLLSKWLKFPVIYVINEPEEYINQDVDFLSAESRAVIGEGISLCNISDSSGSTVYLDTLEKVWLLKEKIWLLKAEVFLKEQLNSSTTFMLSAEDQIKELINGAQELTEDTKFLRLYRFENGMQTLMFIKEEASKFASLHGSFHAQEIEDSGVRNSLLLLLSKIVIFRAKSVLMKLSNSKKIVMGLSKDQIRDLLEGLQLFAAFEPIKEVGSKEVEHIFSVIEAVGRRIISFYGLFLANKITEEIIKNVLAELLDRMKFVETELRKMCLQIPRSSFAMSNVMGFIAFLSGNLLKLVKHDPDSIAPVRQYIEEIQMDLELLGSFMIRILEQNTENAELKDLCERISEVAYKVEYAVDSIEVGIGVHWQHFLSLNGLLEEIRLVKMKANKLCEEKTCDAKVQHVAKISSHMSQASTSEIDKVVLCLSDQEEVIMDRLTRGSSKRDVVSIVGMPGIGKTTLAKKVYADPKVTFYFHRRAWCFVSQDYGKRDLLLNILSDIHGLTDEIQQMTDPDLELKLSQCLRKNRYLIVMDDVWDVGAWHALERSFPDDGNGSRILITSRLWKVAMEATPDSDPHSLRLLSEDESWKLVEMRIFHEGGCCPKDLVEVGMRIAQHCKGLPLAVVAIAGILEKTERRYDCWNKIAKELSSLVLDDPETRCKEILELSYNHLPAHLKVCFLYFIAFQEDRDVQVRKLVRLWIAEGFIQKNEPKCLEEIAEDYLVDLIDRSLVQISKSRSKGGAKACRIHDLLRDLCRSKSKEQTFLQLISRYDESYASYYGSDYGDDLFDYYTPSIPVTYESYRVSIRLKRKYFVDSRASGPFTRSLIFFASNDTYPRRPYNISFIFQQFKLLRVLDLESINMGMSFPAGIELLVQLRYLAVSGDVDSIPQSITNLWKLETFILKGLSGKVVLPDTFWHMTSLRHLHVRDYAAFHFQDGLLQLEYLVTFSSLALSFGEDTEKILKKLPNLRNFRCIFLESWDSARNCNQFPRLDFLTQLETLKILYSGRTHNPGELNLPSNLKKLTLSNFHLPWSHMSRIAGLPKLEVLKLCFGAFEGQTWDMTEGEVEFPELRFLHLESLNIVQWKASPDYLPKLRQLVLRNCKDLQEVPYDLAEIPTLEMIQVQWCGPSIEESIREIEEATEGMQVLISRS